MLVSENHRYLGSQRAHRRSMAVPSHLTALQPPLSVPTSLAFPFWRQTQDGLFYSKGPKQYLQQSLFATWFKIWEDILCL